MTDRPGTNTVSLLQRLLRLERTVVDGKLGQLSSTSIGEFLVVGITAPSLVVLVVWLGIVLGLPLTLILAAATILGLVVVWPSMRRGMRFYTPTEAGDTLSTVPTNLAVDVSNFFEAPDYEGWCGPMENSLSELTAGQLELIGDLLSTYQETEDLTQVEWAEVQSAMDIVEIRLEEL